jgi:hypothetical protein
LVLDLAVCMWQSRSRSARALGVWPVLLVCCWCVVVVVLLPEPVDCGCTRPAFDAMWLLGSAAATVYAQCHAANNVSKGAVPPCVGRTARTRGFCAVSHSALPATHSLSLSLSIETTPPPPYCDSLCVACKRQTRHALWDSTVVSHHGRGEGNLCRCPALCPCVLACLFGCSIVTRGGGYLVACWCRVLLGRFNRERSVLAKPCRLAFCPLETERAFVWTSSMFRATRCWRCVQCTLSPSARQAAFLVLSSPSSLC